MHTDTRTCTLQSIFARIGCCIVITSADKCMIAILFLKQQQHIMNVNVHECALCVHECEHAWVWMRMSVHCAHWMIECECARVCIACAWMWTRGVHGMSLVCMSCVFDVACFQSVRIWKHIERYLRWLDHNWKAWRSLVTPPRAYPTHAQALWPPRSAASQTQQAPGNNTIILTQPLRLGIREKLRIHSQ